MKRIILRYLRSDASDTGETDVILYQGPDALPASDMPKDLRIPRDTQAISHNWSLGELSLSPGDQLTFSIVAEDYKGQRTQTPSRSWLVVSESDLLDRVARRHSAVLNRMQQRLDQQRRAGELIEDVAFSIQETESIDKSVMDRLQSAILMQRQINSGITGENPVILEDLEALRNSLRTQPN